MSKTALVTGDMGFIGSHFAEHLRGTGWQVTGADIVNGFDCRNLFACDSTSRFDLVVHCAANVGGRANIDGHPLNVAQNLGIDAAMFDWAVRTRPRRVLYFSSSAAYPTMFQRRDTGTRLHESLVRLDLVNEPDAVYGWAKVTGERLAEVVRGHGIQVTVVRPFSGYGPRQDDCYPWPAYMARARRLEDPFHIWGDGGSTRDWIHVDDVVDACMALVEDGTPLPVNLGTGRATTFDELATVVCSAAGYMPDRVYVADAPQGVYHRVADPTRLFTVYRPRITLAEGVARAFRE